MAETPFHQHFDRLHDVLDIIFLYYCGWLVIWTFNVPVRICSSDTHPEQQTLPRNNKTHTVRVKH